MKLTKLTVLATALSVVVLYSCTGGPSKMIVKKWQFESIKGKAFDDMMAQVNKMKSSLDTIKDSTMKAMATRNVAASAKMMDDMKNMTMTFNADGTCESYEPDMMSGQMKTIKGKWMLTTDGKTMVRTMEGAPKADSLGLDEVSADKMVVSGNDGQGGKIIMTYKAAM